MGSPIVVMGVSGSGKSTVGAALAQRLRVPFADADDFHPPANIAKMTAGQPLDDDDRHPWLETIGRWLVEHADGGVMSCSALKRKYRDQLRTHDPEVTFLYLAGTPEVIGRRRAQLALGPDGVVESDVVVPEGVPDQLREASEPRLVVRVGGQQDDVEVAVRRQLPAPVAADGDQGCTHRWKLQALCGRVPQ